MPGASREPTKTIATSSPGTSATPLGEELRTVGKVLWQTIPEELRQGVLFTVDAVLDDQGQLWLLETNSNPAVHPDVYPADDERASSR
jgi:D-alanine-D-alanine ligase-like ATP-grasp enzyme